MIKNKTVYLLLILLVLFSCKKDPLEDESQILVGKWRWVKTIKSLTQPQYVYSDPSALGKNCQVEFVKRGLMRYSENGEEILEKKIKFDGSNGCIDSRCSFWFKSNDVHFIKVFSYENIKDTIYISNYPFTEWSDTDGVPREYWNVYVRE